MVQGSNLLEAAQRWHEGLVQQFLRADSQSVKSTGRGGPDLSRALRHATMPHWVDHVKTQQAYQILPGPCGNRNNLRLKMGWVNWIQLGQHQMTPKVDESGFFTGAKNHEKPAFRGRTALHEACANGHRKASCPVLIWAHLGKSRAELQPSGRQVVAQLIAASADVEAVDMVGSGLTFMSAGTMLDLFRPEEC